MNDSLKQCEQEFESEALRINAGRKPKFGDRMRNPWASESNPTRDGYFVRRNQNTPRSGGPTYEFTDGNGKFWETSTKYAFFIDDARATPAQPGLKAALDAAYPIPDSPHASVLQRNYDDRRAFQKGWLANTPASAVPAPTWQNDERTADEVIAALYRRFKDWSKRGFGPDDVTWCEVKADVLSLIAATPSPASDVSAPSPSSVGDAIRAMELSEKIEWSYSTNGENYYGTEESREDAIALALEEIGETEGTFWIGKNKRHFGRGTYIAGSVIEQLQEQAYEDCGEFAETYLDDVTKEEEKELADFITDWSARVDRSSFWTVYDTEQIDIAEVLAAPSIAQDGQKSGGA